MSIKECIKAAKNEFSNVSAEELNQYAKSVLVKARENPNVRGQAAIKQAQVEVGDEYLQRFYEEAQTTINNQVKYGDGAKKIKDKTADSRSLMGRRHNNLGDNVESAQRASGNQLRDVMFKELSPEEFTYLTNTANEMEIAMAYDGVSNHPTAKKIADRMKKYITEARNTGLVNSNAMPLHFVQGDRYFRATHDANRIMRGGRDVKLLSRLKKVDLAESERIWSEDIKKYLDLEETFAHTDGIDVEGKLVMGEVDKILSNIHDNIINYRSEIFTTSKVANDQEAVARKSRMFFVWKDMQSWLAYNQKYGHGTLFNALTNDIEAAGNKIGKATIMGDSAEKMFNAWKHVQDEVNPKGKFWWRNTENLFKEINGDTKRVVNATTATFFGNLRQLTSMARLPTLLLSSITDANIFASYSQRWGRNYFKSWADQFAGYFSQMTSDEIKQISSMMHLNLKSHMGYIGKFTQAEAMSDMMHKISSKYYRYNGMQGWDNGNRSAAMHTTASQLGKNSTRSYDALIAPMRKQLDKFGITSLEWDAIRKPTEGKLLTLDNIEKIPDSDLRKIYDARGGNTPLYEIRSELYRKLFSVFDVAAENSILTPGAWVRSLMNQGTPRGDLLGEVWRTFMQFKGFPLSYIDRTLIAGFKDADGAMAKLGWALSNFGYILPMSYASTYFYYLSQGLSMPDPDQMSLSEKIDFYAGIAFPGAGVFLGIMDANNQNPNLAMSFLTSPTTRVIGASAATLAGLVTGNLEGAKKNASKAFQYLVPSATLPGGSPYIKHILGDEPYLQPGQTQLWGPQ